MYAKKTQSPSGDSASILQQFRNLKCWVKHLLGRVDCQQIQLAILWQLFWGETSQFLYRAVKTANGIKSASPSCLGNGNLGILMNQLQRLFYTNTAKVF